MTNAELITELTYYACIEKRKLLSDAAAALEATEKRIAELEAVDVVPVVRCKDCKHYDGKWCLLLDMVNSDMGDWFCAYGERRTE